MLENPGRSASASTRSTSSTKPRSCARLLMPENDSPVLAFPCDFPIKVMGKTQAGFAQAGIEGGKRHAPHFDPATLGKRPSREGEDPLLTLDPRAGSRGAIDELYSGF